MILAILLSVLMTIFILTAAMFYLKTYFFPLVLQLLMIWKHMSSYHGVHEIHFQVFYAQYFFHIPFCKWLNVLVVASKSENSVSILSPSSESCLRFLHHSKTMVGCQFGVKKQKVLLKNFVGPPPVLPPQGGPVNQLFESHGIVADEEVHF